jgi:DNA repair protein RadC
VLVRFGGVGRLARAHPRELSAVSGIGVAKAATVVAAFELARRSQRTTEQARIASTEDIARLVAPLLAGCTRERLIVVTCDRSNRVLGYDRISEGSADRSLVPVREILVTVLRRDGQAFALAHNHPSGSPDPSHEDITATDQVADAAKAAGLRLLDHVVMTEHNWRRVRRSCETSELPRKRGVEQ